MHLRKLNYALMQFVVGKQPGEERPGRRLARQRPMQAGLDAARLKERWISDFANRWAEKPAIQVERYSTRESHP
ncbi:hypothetical protein EMIT051CA3_30724 [Pseudomonas chlororaphis]